MIDGELAWYYTRLNAKKAMIAGVTYASLVHKRRYRVNEVLKNAIIIERVSGGEIDKLTKGVVLRAVAKLNGSPEGIRRRTLISPTVAKETAFVMLCPFVCWDQDGQYIHACDN